MSRNTRSPGRLLEVLMYDRPFYGTLRDKKQTARFRMAVRYAKAIELLAENTKVTCSDPDDRTCRHGSIHIDAPGVLYETGGNLMESIAYVARFSDGIVISALRGASDPEDGPYRIRITFTVHNIWSNGDPIPFDSDSLDLETVADIASLADDPGCFEEYDPDEEFLAEDGPENGTVM